MNTRWKGCLLEILETVLLTVIIFWVVQNFVAQPFKIYQPSMERTLEPNQMVLVDKLTPVFTGYHRGDVIVFQPPKGFEDENHDPFIKRLIGLPGDLVQIHDDSVYVNGVKLAEPYIYDGQPTTPSTGQSSWRIPDGQFFVMGDHRAESKDSRVFGPIAKSTVVGRAFVRYWPLSTFGVVQSANYSGIPDSPPGSSSEPSVLPSPSQ